jgi:ABC-type uncharacterized transport system auxiliary subunit
MNRMIRYNLALIIVVILIFSLGCSFMGRRETVNTNYYVLDYLPATENPSLIQASPFPKTLEVMETKLPRTYDRNQIVRKKSYTQISYFPNDLWANRLYDAVPNLLVRRLSAYNIFKRVSRDMMETKPDYYLETTINNIEYLDIERPTAFLRLEFVLRDASTQAVIFADSNERTRILYNKTVEYFVQSVNELIMLETDMFASQCAEYLNGKTVIDSFTDAGSGKINVPEFRNEALDFQVSETVPKGQLFLPIMMKAENPVPFVAEYRDTLDINNPVIDGIMNEITTLREGKWRITFGTQNISADVNINANMRTALNPFWSELIIKVIDESQTRIRMQYDIYSRSSGKDAFGNKVDFRYSPSEEIGEYDYLWILKPGNYMVTLNGSSPNSLKDFTTVTLEEGKSYELTMVVNPDGDRTVLVGAGILTTSETKGKLKYHKGAVHTNISLSSSNSVDRDNPTRSISLSSQFDNKVDYDIWPYHFTMKSLYDLGFDKTTGTEFRVNVDSYSLRNALGYYPWKKDVFLKNLGLYGRGDFTTHFFHENAFYQDEKNFIQVSSEQDSLFTMNEKRLNVKDSFYPLRLKEGTGITYRINITPKISLNLRFGYGWQQDYENKAYYFVKEVTIDGVVYQLFRENSSFDTRGIETSVLFSANSLFKIISLTSTLDVLFPTDKGDRSTRFDSENLVNIRLYRNISMDIKANIRYNRVLRDYVITDYNAFLRLSLYY